MITRRHSLALLTSALASPALGQSLGREELPPWYYLNRMNGQAWQDRSGQTLFFSRKNQQLMGASWKAKSKVINSLFVIPDPGNQIMEDIFRLYEVRKETQSTQNPTFVEDFTWLSRSRLKERIWISSYSAVNSQWKTLFDKDHPEKTFINLPNYQPVLWVSPTNDEPLPDQKPDLDLSTEEGESHPIAPLLTGMLEVPVPFASTSLNHSAITRTFDGEKNVWLAKLKQTSQRPQYTHAYFRVFSSRLERSGQ